MVKVSILIKIYIQSIKLLNLNARFVVFLLVLCVYIIFMVFYACHKKHNSGKIHHWFINWFIHRFRFLWCFTLVRNDSSLTESLIHWFTHPQGWNVFLSLKLFLVTVVALWSTFLATHKTLQFGFRWFYSDHLRDSLGLWFVLWHTDCIPNHTPVSEYRK